MEQYSFQTMRDTFEVYVHRDGVYVPECGEIADFCQTNLEEEASNGLIEEVRGHIQRSTLQWRENFDSNPNVMVVENGILNIRTREFKPEHGPEHLNLIKLPVRYDPTAEPVEIKKCLRKSLGEEDKDEEDQIQMRKVTKILGDVLEPNYKYELLCFLVGAGSNGKGVFGRLLKRFVGEKFFSAVRLQTLGNDPFSPADLYGKFVNFGGDIDKEDVKDWAIIRSLTGGDTIRAHKKHGQPFNFKNRAKLIFALNEMPTMDDAYATFRRLVIVPFERVIEAEEKDRDLDAKLQTDTELSGLLNMALQGIEWLEEDDGHNSDESWIEVRNRYVTLKNEVKAFVDAKFVVDDSGKVETNMMREMYAKWAEEHKTEPLDSQRLGEKLASLGFENKQEPRRSRHVKAGEPRLWHYHGLRLKLDSDLDEILGKSQ
jgi:putative DNA primase/helicase